MLWFGDCHLSLEVTGSANAAGRCGPVRRAQTEQSLKGGHRLSPAIVTKDELIQVDGKLGAADAVVGADQPLLEVANGPVGQWDDRRDTATQLPAQGLGPADVSKPRRVQPGEGLQPVGIDGRPGCDMLVEKPGDGGCLEVGGDRHANASRPAAALFHSYQDEGRPPAFQLAAPAQPRLRAPELDPIRWTV